MVSGDFVTSDWHFAHPYVAALRYFQKVNMTANDLRTYCQTHGVYIGEYVDTETHDNIIMDRLNRLYTGGDNKIIVAGDISSGSTGSLDKALKFIEDKCAFPKDKRILVCGNHELMLTKKNFAKLYDVFGEVHTSPLQYSDNVVISHFPVKQRFESDDYWNEGNHRKKFVEYAPIKKDNKIYLYGHTHSMDWEEFGKGISEFNIGIDACRLTAAPIQYFVDLDKERKSENL